MAVTFNTDQVISGTTINGVYARIQTVELKNYDASEDTSAMFKLMYEVTLFPSASVRNQAGESPIWPNRMRCNSIAHFTCAVTLADLNANGANPYTLAYANLKSQLASRSLATNIADAV